MISIKSLVLSTLAAMSFAEVAQAQTGPLKDPIPAPIPQSPIQVQLKPFITALSSPIDVTVLNSNGGQMFILDQKGVILSPKGNGSVKTVLDISGVIAQLTPAFGGAPQGLNPSYDERGLLGLAFHPGFDNRKSPGFRKFYTLHNVPIGRVADFVEPPFPNAAVVPNCQEVIAEWQMVKENGDFVVPPGSYREVLRFDRPEFNHNGGTVAFGPDGLLYAAFGDGGGANDVGDGHNPATGNAQDLSTILGKMIRINPVDPGLTNKSDGTISENRQYRIPHDNPFAGKKNVVNEIYAYGFRNPYRFSFDAVSGSLILADVGQNNIEEVDIIVAGGDFGWHIQEGTFLFDPTTGNVFTNPKPNPKLINPVAEYDHFEATANAVTRIAIVGGFVYRGTKIPELAGRYICADLNGFLFSVNLKNGKLVQLLNTGMFIKGFGQDLDNEILVAVSTNEGPGVAGSTSGSILKLAPVRGKN